MTGRKLATWRLIDTGPLPGPENMAIDEALLACFKPGFSIPVLRLYAWEPAAFSCGRFQKEEEIIDLESCRIDSIPVVKRITGGGVIYHAEELTYSLVCPAEAIPDSRSVKAAFFHLTAFLLDFYSSLGLSPLYAAEHYRDGRPLGERTALCFAGTESCDILIRGKKIGGNAQRRLKETIFQHGSIPLRQMAAKGVPYLMEKRSDLQEKTTSLAEEGVRLTREELAPLLAKAFADRMGVLLRVDALSDAEKKFAGDIMAGWSCPA